MTFVFKHPKYYTELRKRNKAAQVNAHSVSISDQAISLRESETSAGERAPGQGQSSKRQAATGPGAKLQASSNKLRAPSDSNSKPQASSSKILEPR